MAKLSTKLKQKHSRLVYFTTIIILICSIASAYLINQYLITWATIQDNSLAPEIIKDDFVLIKRIINKNKLKLSDYYALQNPDNSKQYITIKKLVALPGDSLKIRASNFRVGQKNIKIKNDNYFSELTKLYIPQKNDSIYLNNLNNTEFDYINKLIKRENPLWDVKIKNQFLKDNIIIDDNEIYSLNLKRKQLNSKVVSNLRWQELELLKLQLDKRHPSSKIKIKRFLVIQDSLNLSTYKVKENYTFVLGNNGRKSLDSREFGYLSTNKIKGKIIYSYRPEVTNFIKEEKNPSTTSTSSTSSSALGKVNEEKEKTTQTKRKVKK